MNDPIVIIGGGLAGLVALNFIAGRGRPAVLFERSRSIGGRARTDTQDGFAMNLGGHALYRTGAARRALDELGVGVAGKRAPSDRSFLIAGGVRHTMPVGLLSTMVTDALPLSSKLHMARLFTLLRQEPDASLDGRSFGQWLDARIGDRDLRAFVIALFRVATYSDACDSFSARAALVQMRKAVFDGVDYVDGGWQTIVDSLADRARSKGAAIVTGSPVARLLHRDRRLSAVQLESGEHIAASAAIVATNPRHCGRLLDFDLELNKTLSELVPLEASCLDVALDRLPDPRARFALGLDRPVYFSVHSLVADLAPPGGALIHCMKYQNGEAGPDDRAELESLMDLMQPGWARRVVRVRFYPSLMVAGAMVPPLGTKGRPPGVAVGSLDNVRLAGDWVGTEHLLADASFASGRAAALELLERTREDAAA
jgi:phytoene dehydrogenase-like protein